MAKGRRERGEGSIRLRRGRFWIRFRIGEKRYERPTDAASRADAARILRDVLASLRRPPSELTVADHLPLIVADYEHKGQGLDQISKRWKHLRPVFGEHRAEAITTTDLVAYVAARRAAGAAASTIQNELACLRRILRLAHQHTPPLLERVPKFPTVRVDNVRTNTISEEQYHAVMAELPDYLRAPLAFGYWTGWRRGEVFGLRRDQVDLDAGTARLDAAQTKNREPRTIYLPPELARILDEHEERTRAWERRYRRRVRTFFHHNGKPIRSHYAAWRSATKRAGLPDARFHDLRRVAAIAYSRANVPEQVTMRILGQRTRSIFARYRIVEEYDLRDAASRVGRAPNAPPKGAGRRPPVAKTASRIARKSNKSGT